MNSLDPKRHENSVLFRLMGAKEAVEFLKLPYNSFREIAPDLPRHHVTPARFVYLRRQLLAWLSGR